jgi:uncharacterized protein with GYD domain
MASKGYLLIEAAVGRAKDVAVTVKSLAGVREAYLITGPCDVVAIVEGDDANEVSNIVATQVHAVGGNARTITCLAVDY